MKFPNMIQPLKNEDYLSVLRRMIRENSITSPDSLLKNFLCDPALGRKNLMHENYSIASFLEAVPLPLDAASFYLNHTMFPLAAPLLSRSYQASLVNEAFFRNFWPDLVSKHKLLRDKLLFCEDCIKEDISDTGYACLHREHLAPGVKVCSVHGTPLRPFTGDAKKFLFGDISLGDAFSDVSDIDFSYAGFVSRLIEIGPDLDLDTSRQALRIRAKELGYCSRSNTFRQIAQDASKDGFGAYASVASVMSQGEGTRQYCEGTLKLLLFLFGDAENFAAYAEKNSISSSDEWFDPLEYEQSGGRGAVVQLFHISCGKEFVTTPYGFANGWKCPHCESGTVSEKAQELVNLSGKREYEMLQEFKSMTAPVKIRHKCGCELDMTLGRFLIDEVRCPCRKSLSFEEAARQISRNGEYELLSFFGSIQPVTIRHNACGKTFRITKYNDTIYMKQLCPFCRKKADDEKRSGEFLQKLKNLVGDEYSALGELPGSRQNVEIMHNTCGGISEYSSRAFLEGTRCPYCREPLSGDEFKRMVQTVSGGKYEIIDGLPDGRFVIRNNTDGTETVQTKRFILQEFRRPTKSPVFPMDIRYPFHTVNTISPSWKKKNMKEERLLETVREKEDPNGIYFYNRSDFSEWSKDNFEHLSGSLIAEGRLFRLGKGIYSCTSGNIPPRIILESIYLLKDGKRIGFFGGRTLAYDLGIDDRKPEELCIVSNMRLGRTHSCIHKESFGVRIVLCRPPAVITEDNLAVLKIINLADTCIQNDLGGKEIILRMIEKENIRIDDFVPYLGKSTERIRNEIYSLYDRKYESSVTESINGKFSEGELE